MKTEEFRSERRRGDVRDWGKEPQTRGESRDLRQDAKLRLILLHFNKVFYVFKGFLADSIDLGHILHPQERTAIFPIFHDGFSFGGPKLV